MAVLADGVQYGLSSHGLSSENKSLVFVKLTDSSLKAIEEYLKNKLKTSQSPSIQFLGNEGRLWFPSADDGSRAFSFTMSSAAVVGGPQGSFECVQQCGSRSLESLGVMAQKMNVQAKEDVYEATRQRMAVAEEESKKNCTRVIKLACGPDIGRVVKIRKQAAAVFPPRRDRGETSPPSSNRSSNPTAAAAHHRTENGRTSSPSLGVRTTGNAISPLPRSAASPSYTTASSNASTTSSTMKEQYLNSAVETNPELMRRPLRERIIHLLAIRPYKKPELFSRLQREGLKEKDKKLITHVLMAVGLMKDQAYHLARHIWNDVHDDWPFFTNEEKQILKRRKPQNLTPPVSDSSSGSGHSPPSTTTLHSNGSPAIHKTSASPSRPVVVGGVKRPKPENLAILDEKDAAALAAAMAAKKPRISHYKKPDSSQHESRQVAPPTTVRTPSVAKVRPSPPPSQPRQQQQQQPQNYYRSPTVAPPTRVTSSTDGPDTPNSSPDSLTTEDTEVPLEDYTQVYQRILTCEQRSRYKEEFNARYNEYRNLHKAIDKVSKRFSQLEDELRQAHEGTSAWQRIKSQIVREYQENLRDSQYRDNKRRFQHLHEKLAHIKRLVLEWDTAQTCRS